MRHFILIIFSLTSFISYAQEVPIAKIYYVFKHINDTTQRDKFLQDDVKTLLGQYSSYYTTASQEKMEAAINQQMSSASFDGNLVISRSGTAIKSSYIIDVHKNKIDHIYKIAGRDYLLDEEMPELDWEILEDTKEIGGYTCQKAVANFKGRVYEAWFTTEIPMPFGPWKLHGLPGLILAAADTKNEVFFEYAGFEKTEGNSTVRIDIPMNATKVTQEEVNKLDKAFKENPSAFMSAQSGGSSRVAPSDNSGGSTATVMVVGRNSGSVDRAPAPQLDASKIKSVNIKNDEGYKPSRVTNNPIELIP